MYVDIISRPVNDINAKFFPLLQVFIYLLLNIFNFHFLTRRLLNISWDFWILWQLFKYPKSIFWINVVMETYVVSKYLP